MTRSDRQGDLISVAARDAALLLNEAVRDLLTPHHLMRLAGLLESKGIVSETYASTLRRAAMMAAVNGVHRLAETESNFLTPWLFSQRELQDLGFPSVRLFVRDWRDFVIVRHQWMAHPTAKKASPKRPGRIIQAAVLGRALVRTGLGDEESFLRRVGEELVPAAEKVRDEIFARFSGTKDYVYREYLEELQQGADDGSRTGEE